MELKYVKENHYETVTLTKICFNWRIIFCEQEPHTVHMLTRDVLNFFQKKKNETYFKLSQYSLYPVPAHPDIVNLIEALLIFSSSEN